MVVYKLETTLQQDGNLTLNALPFQAGERVEVIILSVLRPADETNPYPLRGKAYCYEAPFEPVAEQDWEAAS